MSLIEIARPELRPFVYIAGPYSHPDPWRNTVAAVSCGNRLLDSGSVVPVVPHLTFLWDHVTSRPVEEWYAYDLAILSRCDAVLRLPGESSGADREVARAAALGIPVFATEEEALSWSRKLAAIESAAGLPCSLLSDPIKIVQADVDGHRRPDPSLTGI